MSATPADGQKKSQEDRIAYLSCKESEVKKKGSSKRISSAWWKGGCGKKPRKMVEKKQPREEEKKAKPFFQGGPTWRGAKRM